MSLALALIPGIFINVMIAKAKYLTFKRFIYMFSDNLFNNPYLYSSEIFKEKYGYFSVTT
jgi:hypothetical protein